MFTADRQELMDAVSALPETQLSTALEFVLLLRAQETPLMESQAYQEWVSAENDIYDELFQDETAAQ